MNLSAPFILRPIATSLLMAGLLLCGLATYPLLPVGALPNVNYPTIQISAQLPGADPQTIASSVATPLEQQLSQIPGVTQLTSSSALGRGAAYRPVRTLAHGRQRGRRCARRDQRREPLSAAQYPLPADDQEGESRRRRRSC